ncbi:putative serine/threonine-protein kinase roco5 [Canna indica]|uniref:Serine/threonine-protein kinase roco5 n=1 Tax=Canna indica TaxID=4628 RepID=A0AAQ3QKI4_9LILI|nr:putative serine/threonine-protein kinase roco5 [Canna indica]
MKIKKEQEEDKKKKKKSSSVMQENEGTVELQKKKKESEDGQGKTVVVGIKMDAESRELLTWSLVKIADAGDRVVALHVLPSTAPCNSADANGSCSSLLSLVKAFDATLAVYEGFCNLKQVELKMKIARGSSIRKVLVREAVSYGASRLVVGVAKNDHAIGYSSTSIAKYCARKLPRDCSVFAVSNGKTLFKREASPASHPQEIKKSSNQIKNRAAASAAQQALTRSYSKLLSSRAEKSAVLRTQSGASSSFSSSPNLKKTNSNCVKIIARAAAEETVRDQQPSTTVPVRKPDPPPATSISLLLRDSSEAKPGWPLLRKAVLPERQTHGPKISVVQWAMRLPSRFSATSTVHPDQKARNLDVGAIAIMDEADSPREERKIPKELEHLHDKYSSVGRLFGYKELAQMTSDFSPENLIGKGGSSRVYKGSLSDGKELAVKILNPSEDAINEFVSEIEIITDLHHKNIVSLFGFCCDEENLILVYDYLSRGSLEDNLHGESLNKTALGWAERYKIAVGVAEALDYLHCNAQPVIHRDVKSSNILLSDNHEPQLADFGLAKFASASASQLICNDVAGTFGYLAPEYFMYGKVNEKIDVYAFGVVLLELVSGRKPVSTGCPKGQESLVMWAMPILQGGEEVKELVDPSLGTDYDRTQLERMILAASLCLKRAPQSRPRITLVLKLLHGDDDDVLRWARSSQAGTSGESDAADDEAVFHNDNIRSHIHLALQDIDDDSSSVSSVEPPTAGSSLEEYLQGRWSRSSSFD